MTEYTPTRINLIDASKADIETAVNVIAKNNAEAGDILTADGEHGVTWTKQVITTLPEDLYTYADIGKITGASNTSPKLVAREGSSMLDVFKAIMGDQQDQDPNVKVILKIDTNQSTPTSFDGDEIGTAFPSTLDIFITVRPTATGEATYGVNYGDNQSTYSKTHSTSFNYLIDSSRDYDFIISSSDPASCSDLVDAEEQIGEIVSADLTEGLKCRFGLDDNNNVCFSMKIRLHKHIVSGPESINIFGQLTVRDCNYSNAKFNNQDINYFYTYLGTECKTPSIVAKKNSGTFPFFGTTEPYVFTAGRYYPYIWFQSSSEPSEYPTFVSADRSVDDLILFKTANLISGNGIELTTTESGYLWLLVPTTVALQPSCSICQYAFGEWTPMATTITSSPISVKLNSGSFSSDYVAIRTDELVAGEWIIGVYPGE